MLSLLHRCQTTRVIAHRGARAYAPENTQAAFEKAVTLTGADAIELDVQLSADGVVMVCHDDTLTRTTNAAHKLPAAPGGGYPLHHYSAAQLLQLDAGSWFVKAHQDALQGRPAPAYLHQRQADELHCYLSDDDLRHYGSGSVTLPTLASVLTWAQQAHVELNIEIKEGTSPADGTLAQQVVALVQRHGMAHHTLISSFSRQQLQHLRKWDAQLPIALLADRPQAHVEEQLRALGANAYHPGCTPPDDALGDAAEAHIAQWQKAGFAITLWTCNDKSHMARWIDAGVCGIISDLPNRVREMVMQQTTHPRKIAYPATTEN
ncbi:glycerophosphoryl diester phosphodiesterase [Magnetococcus marinus MC-1]|uniref:Glycerophosphoryl diester phosphodiesterase n=1 Tax=Magnetococcus marinus (strain ATCC BAA-1437 / JCM 17883 / MC-1) TaxID=156889 RepID=A0L5C4_MAGMM|nr:glycerophosphodiester phosphodiesterase family protein [Magnetococcus marinus]ABK43167.1 glycerophosphoryl diester phosphodiesterase [Magnetococcus marinus MC-1]